MPAPIEKVVIVGGGTAGWMAAAVFAKYFGRTLRIELVESEEIGTVGVGEATIPQLRILNSVLGLDEYDFLRATQGTYKLGIEFVNWRQIGDAYIHTFGTVGPAVAQLPFYQYWLRARGRPGTADLWKYSTNAAFAAAGRFARAERLSNSAVPGIAWAYHFDAGLYAAYLRKQAEGRGVVRTEGRIVGTEVDPQTGFLTALRLTDDRRVEGELFIDCSGFRGLIIGDAMGVPYEDWSHFLPVDRAVAVPTAKAGPPIPYTRATAHAAGWQWRIPLQHRTGNGHVYCSAFISDDEAAATLRAHLDGETLAEPRILRFQTGRRRAFWEKNVVALGLASGFMEPLESTSIHLVQSALSRLVNLFPDRGFDACNIREFNAQLGLEFERIRDFIILHYHRTDRDDSPFWNYVRTMSVPDSLRHKIELFARGGKIYREAEDLFTESSWLQVMLGQGVNPASHHAIANNISEGDLDELLRNVQQIVTAAAAQAPTHAAFLAQHCAAPAG